MSTPKERRKDKFCRQRKSKRVARVYEAPDAEELEAIEADCDREMFGDDADYLRDCGWIDKHF